VLAQTFVTIQLRDLTLTICPCSGGLDMRTDIVPPLLKSSRLGPAHLKQRMGSGHQFSGTVPYKQKDSGQACPASEVSRPGTEDLATSLASSDRNVALFRVGQLREVGSAYQEMECAASASLHWDLARLAARPAPCFHETMRTQQTTNAWPNSAIACWPVTEAPISSRRHWRL
jgi:hypothetical protein